MRRSKEKDQPKRQLPPTGSGEESRTPLRSAASHGAKIFTPPRSAARHDAKSFTTVRNAAGCGAKSCTGLRSAAGPDPEIPTLLCSAAGAVTKVAPSPAAPQGNVGRPGSGRALGLIRQHGARWEDAKAVLIDSE